MILEITDLIHHLLIDGKTTGSIDDNHVIAIGLCLLDSMVGNNTYILIIRLTIYRNTNLFTHNMELLDSSRTVNVAVLVIDPGTASLPLGSAGGQCPPLQSQKHIS